MMEIEYTIGAWALPYLVNGDASGLDDAEHALLDRWLDDAVSAFKDDDGQRWEFSHEVIDTDSRLDAG